jgi:hypothetical protein
LLKNPKIRHEMTMTRPSSGEQGTRHVFATKPPSVEYRLSPLGESLLEPMASLVDWADTRYSDIHDARARFDGAPCGEAR